MVSIQIGVIALLMPIMKELPKYGMPGRRMIMIMMCIYMAQVSTTGPGQGSDQMGALFEFSFHKIRSKKVNISPHLIHGPGNMENYMISSIRSGGRQKYMGVSTEGKRRLPKLKPTSRGWR